MYISQLPTLYTDAEPHLSCHARRFTPRNTKVRRVRPWPRTSLLRTHGCAPGRVSEKQDCEYPLARVFCTVAMHAQAWDDAPRCLMPPRPPSPLSPPPLPSPGGVKGGGRMGGEGWWGGGGGTFFSPKRGKEGRLTPPCARPLLRRAVLPQPSFHRCRFALLRARRLRSRSAPPRSGSIGGSPLPLCAFAAGGKVLHIRGYRC